MLFKTVAPLSGALLSLTVAAMPAQAAIVVMNISGAFGAQPNAPSSLPFEGTITYDTSSLTYQDGGRRIYGSVAPNGMPKAGSYSIDYGGSTFASTVNFIDTDYRAQCNAGGFTSPCYKIDMVLKSAVPGFSDGRLIVILKTTAPFTQADLPDTAPSSANAFYARFEMPQQFIGTRTTETQPNPAHYIPAGAGASLTFGPGGVPEPGTWAMMLLGFAAVGVTARRTVHGRVTYKSFR